MPALKIGLFGCGSIARLVHLNILTRLPDVTVVALAESDPQRQAEMHQRVPQAATFTDYHDLLEKAEVDAVVICLPNALHAEAAIAALQRGKPVYVEKPLATNLEDGRRVLAAWRRAGVVGMSGLNLRFHELFHTTKQYLQGNRLGPLIAVRSTRSTAPYPLPPWKLDRRSGGGVLLDLASHHIDLVHFLFESAIREVYAEIRSQQSEGDSAMLQLRLANGVPVQAFFALNTIEEDFWEIYGHVGKLKVDRYASTAVEIIEPTPERSKLALLQRGWQTLARSPSLLSKFLAPNREPSYRVALAHFVGAVRDKRPVHPDLGDAYRSLAVIEAAEESARINQTVVVPNLVDEDFTR
jgi:myo-inositol 2-dehydrogenase/D-chiro-inositol 1-dehydrogenase